MLRRFAAAIGAAALVALLGANLAFAGELTGNGKSLHVENSKWGTGLHARSFCAFSGQEDLQFEDENGVPLETPHKGDPGHAQSWGQIPHDVRSTFPAAMHPGRACNPNYGPPPEG
ncbi:MAG TPA: hypothetical protein VFI34_10485 [Candidatus Limnocylindrales bacterium]|nr:hypothetical protein [Candidatus Limnocylindrales bacterium]